MEKVGDQICRDAAGTTVTVTEKPVAALGANTYYTVYMYTVRRKCASVYEPTSFNAA